MTPSLDDDVDDTPAQDAALTGDEPLAAQDEPADEAAPDRPDEAASEPCPDDPVEGAAGEEALGEGTVPTGEDADEPVGEAADGEDGAEPPAEEDGSEPPAEEDGSEPPAEDAADEPVGEAADGEDGSEPPAEEDGSEAPAEDAADSPHEDGADEDTAADGGSGEEHAAEDAQDSEPAAEVAAPAGTTREAATAEEPADMVEEEPLDQAPQDDEETPPDEATQDEEADLPELPPSFPPKVRPVPLPVPGARSEDDSEPEEATSRRGSTLMVIVLVLVLTALIKTFVVQAFEIPSSSMESTLETGDRVVVTMYDADQIERGDIVVFHDPGGWLNVTDPTGWRGLVQDAMVLVRLLPEGTGHHLIKRVIGLPGDHVVADSSGAVSVNGVVLEESYVKAGSQGSEVAFDIVVPDACVWVMGDNRSNSLDSRYHQGDAHGGAVPLTEVVGVAKGVLWPVGHWALLNEGEEVFAEVPDAETGTQTENEP